MSARVAPLVSLDDAPNTSTTKASEGEPCRVVSSFLKKMPPDVYGQVHVIETPELISDSLELLEYELWSLPEEKISGIKQASFKCPGIFESDDHRLMFLRCEQFNVDLAAIRMTKYWDRRIELFQDAAFSPLTISNALKQDTKELALGFFRLLPDADETGRSNIFLDPSIIEGQNYDNESMVRAAWYCLHAALEDVTTQKKGIVFLVYLRNTFIRHFDRTLVSLISGSVSGILPVRVSCIHIFHAPYLFEILFDVISLLLGERLTKRIKMYSGEKESIINKLHDFGISEIRIPIELGGAIRLNHEKWLAYRKDSENQCQQYSTEK